jgi:hypothetical protein
MQINQHFRLHAAILLASVWGLSEAALGMGLRKCAAVLSGSLMTGAALLFLGAGWVLTRRYWALLLMVGIASLFKLFDALLLSLPILHGAVGNPIFAFFMEGAALILLLAVLQKKLVEKTHGQAVLGGFSALMAVNLFPLVRFATGVPACVVSGTGYPLSLYYAYVAVGLSMVTVPLGFWLGQRIASLESRLPIRRQAVISLLSPAALILCLALVFLIRKA